MTDKRVTVGNLEPEERTPCEVWSRVMGYHRPVVAFNAGKQQEFRDRVMFTECRCGIDATEHADWQEGK